MATTKKTETKSKNNGKTTASSRGNSTRGTSSNKNTGTQRTAKSSNSRTKAQTNHLRKKKNSELSFGKEITMLVVIGLGILLFISCFTWAGENLSWLRNGEYFVFGNLMYVMPFVIVFLFWLFLYREITGKTVMKLVGGALVFTGVSGLFSVIAQLSDGGLVGQGMYHLLFEPLGTVGLYVVLIILILIGFVLLTETSIIALINRGGKTAVTTAVETVKKEVQVHKENGAIRAEARAIRKDQQELQRMQMHQKNLEELKKKREAADETLQRQRELTRRRQQRMQPIQGIGDTTIHDEDMMPMREITTPVTKAETPIPDFTDQPFLVPDQPEMVLPEIKLPDELFSDDEPTVVEKSHRVESSASPILEEEDSFEAEQVELPPHLAADERYTEEQKKEVASYTKTIVTKSGKVIEVETDGIAGEKPHGTAPEKEEVKEEVVMPNAYAEPEREYVFPPMNLLSKGAAATTSKTQMQKELKETAMKLQQTLQNFGVGVTVTNISCGPSVTRYELQPEQGVKVSKIVSLTDDIKLNLAAADIRMEAPIPGKAAVGIEVPNKVNQTVMLRDILESPEFKDSKSKLVFGTGRNIDGRVMVADIAKMPHLLIAGATGSGKSVCINTIVMSILYHAKPTEVKMIMVDPKVVELSVYNGIPHLLLPVVTDPKKAAAALNWAVAEMTNRYQSFAEFGVRDMHGYNEMIDRDHPLEGGEPLKKMPQIVIIVDELADLMMVAPGEVEDAICRLAQMARAAGIHLIIATQRPSVNVITGLIKANVPSRIAFSVSSGVDSRTIIDMNGAEKLLGKGDMLYYPAGIPKPVRVQGAFVSDKEVSAVVDFLKDQGVVKGASVGKQIDIDSVASGTLGGGGANSEYDEYFNEAGKFIIEKEKASIGMLQRMFKIGFNRAARIMDQLCEAGVVGEEEGTKPRKVLMTMEEFSQFLQHKEE